ncbi:MAG TPA: 2-dehydropantoate 2-reductase [Aquifex sp.]|nr:2-dehydropantoate 2-reductase [Aquifex sp.]
MRFLVYGLGAIGSAFAAFLKRAGHEVYAVGRERIVKPVRERGLRVTGIWGDFTVTPDGVETSLDKLPTEDFDLVILSVKSYDTERALEDLQRVNFKYLLLAQNGYGNYEKAVGRFGKEKVILSRVIFGAEIPEPGTVKITVIAAPVVIGNPDGAIPEGELIKIAETINGAGIPTEYSPDVYKYLWDKILYNSALNPLGALLETNYGTLAQIPETRELMNSIIREIFAVAKAKGIDLFWNDAEEYIEHFYKNLIPPTAGHYPSMLQDIRAGKRTEIDALNGAIVGLGREVNVPTPVNETITKLVKAKEKIVSKEG